jgi:hypothetical protein
MAAIFQFIASFPYENIIFCLRFFLLLKPPLLQKHNYDVKQSLAVFIEWPFSKRQGILCEV